MKFSYLLKKVIYAFVYFFFSCVLAVSAEPEPRPVDPSLDANFEVKIRNGFTYCVAPYLGRDGYYYAYEEARKDSLDCVYHDWRYDVHGHISTVISTGGDRANESYLCMTDVASSDPKKFAYIRLLPCAVNNPRQIWKYNPATQQMVNQHSGNKIQEINWFLATSANADNLNDLAVTGRQILFVLITEPMSLAYQFSFHYSFNDKSYTQIIGKDGHISQGALRYDLATKQISTLMKDGKQYCLRSNMLGSSKDSEFVSFMLCPDSYADGIVPNPLKWNILSNCAGKGNPKNFDLIIKDYNGNFFGVERDGGIKIGTGYTIKPSALAKIPDRFKPLYVFKDTGETSGRQNYLAGNYFGSLRASLCPTPGTFYPFPDNNNRLNNRLGLPPDFNIFNWIHRLYLISTHPGGDEAAGPCGPCMLHGVEMILEMHRHGNNPPSDDIFPQYFSFNPESTSIEDFRERYPALADGLFNLYEDAFEGAFDAQSAALDSVRAAEFLGASVLCNLFGGAGLEVSSTVYYTEERRLRQTQLQAMLQELRVVPEGTMFMINYELMTNQGDTLGHSLILVFADNELHAIPTAESTEIAEVFFEQLVDTNIRTTAQLERALRLYQQQTYVYIQEAVIFTITPEEEATPEENFDETMLSVGNCTEGGAIGGPNIDHGFGAGFSFPVPSDLYQCVGGRCDTSLPESPANKETEMPFNWPGRCQYLAWDYRNWYWRDIEISGYEDKVSCQKANQCGKNGICLRWINIQDIGNCEYLGRDKNGHWYWQKVSHYSSIAECRGANICNGIGPCFQWNAGRPKLGGFP